MSLNRRVEECIDVLQERKLDILGLSETKWKGKGTKEIRGGHHLYWSGGVNGRNGVGIILSDKMNEIVVDVNYVSDRLMIIKLKIDPVRILNLIQCYAPQAGSDDQEKQNFEQLLEDKIQDPNTLVMGDLNAQVGCDRQGFEEIMGAHGWGPRNAEGENLLDLCTRNSLVLTNTWFYKRKSHKVTRYGWNGQQESLIDYFLINKELHNTVIDVKVIPSVSLGSDHRLLVGTFRFKKLRAMKTGQDKKIKVWKLKDSEKAREFENKIREKVPNTEPTSVEEEWNAYKKSMIEAAEQVCGRTGGVRKWKETPWWNERTRKAVLEKNNMFRNYFKRRTPENKEKYKEAKINAQRVISEERTKWLDEWSDNLEKDIDGNKKMLYGMIKNKRRDKGRCKYVTDDYGDLLTEPEEIKNCWKIYFKNLLNVAHEECEETNQRELNVETLTEETDITWNDIDYVWKFIKTGKSPGCDEISGEMIKSSGMVGKHWLYRLFKKIWEEKSVPREWKKGIIIPLFKKGDRKKCANYRGITLTSQVAKLYERIIERKIRPVIEETLNEEQHGFRPGRSTNDLIFTIRQLMEKHYEYDKPLWIAFLDIKKAFDAIVRVKVWEALKNIGVKQDIIDRIAEMYRGISSAVKTCFGLTESFEIESGLRQGGVLSPLLFVTVMDEIQKRVEDEVGSGGMKLTLFADDIALYGTTSEEVQQQITAWTRNARQYGLIFSQEKSEVLVLNRFGSEEDEIDMDGVNLKKADKFKYLGSTLSKNGELDIEITQRIESGGKFYQVVRDLIWNKKVPQKCKKVLYNTYYIPILTYGSETWAMRKKDKSRIQAAEMKFLRSIAGKTRRDRIRNDDIRRMLQMESLEERMRKGRLRWYGHMKRMNCERLPKKMYEMRMEGMRPRGRPRYRYSDVIRADIQRKQGNWKDIEREQRYNDRNWWRGFVHRPVP
ncbi:hypothetical protein M8J77_006965 [Diaphorina citri]|nr:hypothetical protein M8J77_006965 [Diaphorina citri]